MGLSPRRGRDRYTRSMQEEKEGDHYPLISPSTGFEKKLASFHESNSVKHWKIIFQRISIFSDCLECPE